MDDGDFDGIRGAPVARAKPNDMQGVSFCLDSLFIFSLASLAVCLLAVGAGAVSYAPDFAAQALPALDVRRDSHATRCRPADRAAEHNRRPRRSERGRRRGELAAAVPRRAQLRRGARLDARGVRRAFVGRGRSAQLRAHPRIPSGRCKRRLKPRRQRRQRRQPTPTTTQTTNDNANDG